MRIHKNRKIVLGWSVLAVLFITLVSIHVKTAENLVHEPFSMSRVEIPNYYPENDGKPCVLPSSAETAIQFPPDTNNWKLGENQVLGVGFKYPPTWSTRTEYNGDTTIIPPSKEERQLPYRGDSDEIYGIHVSISTDYNGLDGVTIDSVKSNLSHIKYPIKTRWIETSGGAVLLAYCIYEASEGITALIPTKNSVLQISIPRFAAGLTSQEDWKTFFGILNSLTLSTHNTR
jgi:hypothetical protein